MLVVTLGAGVLALLIGLRAVGFLSVLGAILALVALWYSPIRRLKTIDSLRSGE